MVQTSQAGTRTSGSGEPVLSVRDLVVEYRVGSGSTKDAIRAIEDVSFDLAPNESLALIGESGCGKTTLGLAMLRLLPKLGVVPQGEVLYRRRDGSVLDMLSLNEEELRRFRWSECAMVFQGAMNSFNPVLRIWDQMLDTVRAHDKQMSKQRVKERCAEVLKLVDLDPDRVLNSYPHELSGGMRQRVLIATSLMLEPQVLVLDEPTTALDLLTQRGIVDVLHQLRERLEFAMIFVSHDLGLAAELADRVATMYDGHIVELGDVRDIFYRPQHPYTKSLINAVPTVAEESSILDAVPVLDDEEEADVDPAKATATKEANDG
ncbi:ABC transporter ATP-binding protein [Tenggerimyces flavus]|uniref:ABC transporter ATP-binding protein n=1 Tax=Tenggerimyces flavus TaxID=1708749 RepID=A0ABV7YKH5_9ACTN|nr:ABC transporter ATP-binding protein [Tenggerimyces flavus]MBM7787698.1 peptide/nickel transport system ATP-binding protein [Tenggerimyces flavus]